MQGLKCDTSLAGKCQILDFAQLPSGSEQGAHIQRIAAAQLQTAPNSIFIVQNLQRLSESGVPVVLQLLGARTTHHVKRAALLHDALSSLRFASFLLRIHTLAHTSKHNLRTALRAGEQGQLNQPECNVSTTGAAVLLVAPASEHSAAQQFEDTLSSTVGAASAAALARRVSAPELHLNTNELRVARQQAEAAEFAAQQRQAGDAAPAQQQETAAAVVKTEHAVGSADVAQMTIEDWADAETGGTPADPAPEAEGIAAVTPQRRDSVDSAGSDESAQSVHIEL